ncbi:MAG: C40 family peptidase [Pseudomonadota bacterium]
MHFPWLANTDGENPRPVFLRVMALLFAIIFSLSFFTSDVCAARSKKKKTTRLERKAALKKKSKCRIARSKAKRIKRIKRIARKRHQVESITAQKAVVVPDGNPLMKIVPLDNRKYLLEPIDNTARKGYREDPGDKVAPKEPVASDSKSKPESAPPEPTALKATNPDLSQHKDQEEGYYAFFTNLLVGTVKQLVGVPYKFGGTSVLKGIDCSAFVREVFSKFAISLPRSSREQAKLGMLITSKYDKSKLKIGDVLFFKLSPSSRQIGHTGIYIGDGKMIHAARADGGVTISSLEKAYFQNTFVAAKRFFVFSEGKPNKI